MVGIAVPCHSTGGAPCESSVLWQGVQMVEPRAGPAVDDDDASVAAPRVDVATVAETPCIGRHFLPVHGPKRLGRWRVAHSTDRYIATSGLRFPEIICDLIL